MMLGRSLLALLPLASAMSNQALWMLQSRDATELDTSSTKEDWAKVAKDQKRSLCFILPDKNGGDDAARIADALNNDCRSKSLVVLPGKQYNMKTNIKTVDLDDVQFHLLGRLKWSTDIDYWLSVSMEVGFQNQSTVWYFGGENVHWDGHGTGTLDGNGQVWYDWAKSQGNLPHRPMMINWRGFNHSTVRRTNFVQSQMWTMATTWSHDLLFEDIYVNNTSNSQYSTLNTDGIDTIYSDNITLRRWDITQGDDCVALKGNSSNVSVYDSIFRGGQGFAIGSLGQYKDKWEYIKNFYAKNITMYDTNYGIYLKTWGGNSSGYPPNGGGGGLGHAEGVHVEDIEVNGARTAPVWLWQCENYEGGLGKDCDSSKFTFSDLSFKRFSGTTAENKTLAVSLRCAEKGYCDDVTVEDMDVTEGSTGKPLTDYWCTNVHNYHGFKCGKFPPGWPDDY